MYKSNYIEKENIARVWDILKPLDGDTPSCSSFLYSYSTTKDIDGNDKLICHHILYEKGSVGEFLKGFFGYNSNPNYLEFFLWLFFLIFGVKKWADFYYIGSPK